MKAFIQWATRTARDYQLFDSSAWAELPVKADPVRTSPIPTNQLDNNPGWVADLGVQGISFGGADHYHVRDLQDGSGGIAVTCWYDNPTLTPVGQRFAQVWTLLPLAPDDRFGGALNTRQSQVLYYENRQRFPVAIENTTFAPWSEFVPPPPAEVRHGIWVTDAFWQTLLNAQTQHGWREWIA